MTLLPICCGKNIVRCWLVAEDEGDSTVLSAISNLCSKGISMYATFVNVNDAFSHLCRLFSEGSSLIQSSTSRNGTILRVNSPVLITYTSPNQRVLFNGKRDVNPFSLLYEALWTLAGRNDVAPIAYYTPRMMEYSDDGKIWHGAYGHRWRYHFNYDQLNRAIDELKRSKDSRRVVLEMWDTKIDGGSGGKDYPCNTHCYVTMRQGKLNLTVCNRSNDMVWGLLAANYVVFSVLIEYLAACVGVEVGVYHHFTNDLHVYCERADWKPEEWLAVETYDTYPNPTYNHIGWEPFPLVKDPATFDTELPKFVELNKNGNDITQRTKWEEPFLQTVAQPMCHAFHMYKANDLEAALVWCSHIEADDWRIAATQWIQRRIERRAAKANG